MNKILWILGVSLLTACTTQPPQVKPTLMACGQNRPQICTMDYRPACGFNAKNQAVRTFGNACAACADVTISGYQLGECQK
ncbi:MAG: hypothetical protein ACRCV6_06780 [Formosimonas sp.]